MANMNIINPEETTSSKPLVMEDEDTAAAAGKVPAAEPEDDDAIKEDHDSVGDNSSTNKKKRTWKKPKDKPKRPLSAYNIFFQHQRSRIVEGHEGEAEPEEIVRSIEGILTKSREKRRHRKTHGRISFGDLARAIADQWKLISPRSKAIFDHYAEVDMMRYRRELKVWREKKELESEAQAIAKHHNFMNQMNSSFTSTASAPQTGSGSGASSGANFLDDLPDESGGLQGQHQQQPGFMNESFNSSYSSVNSDTSFSLTSPRQQMQQQRIQLQVGTEPENIQSMIHRQQQILQEQLRDTSSSTPFVNFNRQQQQQQQQQQLGGVPGTMAFHSSFTSLPAFNPNNNNNPNANMNPHHQQEETTFLNDMVAAQQQQQQRLLQQQQQQQRVLQQQQQQLENMIMMQQQQQQSAQQQQQQTQWGDSSNASLQMTDSLHGPPAHVSDYSSSFTTRSGHASGLSSMMASSHHNPNNNSYHSINMDQYGSGNINNNNQYSQFHSSGLSASDGLIPPSSSHSRHSAPGRHGRGGSMMNSFDIMNNNMNSNNNPQLGGGFNNSQVMDHLHGSNSSGMDMDRSFSR